MRVTICAATYKRPAGLARLLDGLTALSFSAAPPELRVVIVDNDPEGSARRTCDEWADKLSCPLTYVVEARRGISFARNAALAHAADTDWIGFIDDDETPEPRWLDELLKVQREYNADVVTGPVVPHFLDAPPNWMVKGRFFDGIRRATGSVLGHAFTGNVLFRSQIRDDPALRFDHRWALIGGGDRHFFARVAEAGFRIVWADEAVVRESVPKSRANVRWILRRGFRIGAGSSNIRLDLEPGFRTRLELLGVGTYRIAKGLFFLPLTWRLGKHMVVTYLRHICYGAGMLAGWFGLRYKEYRKTDGA